MNLNNSNIFFSRMLSVIGIVSTSFLLGLPALAQLQSEVASKQSNLTNGQLLSQSEDGDSGESDSADGSDDSSSDNDSDNASNDSDASDSNDTGSNASGGDGDSGETAGTRGDTSEGGSPYVGVGEPPSEDSLYRQ